MVYFLVRSKSLHLFTGTACLNGTYGKDCIGKCGVCLGEIPCDHVTGLCAGGCANGWTGEKCKNS